MDKDKELRMVLPKDYCSALKRRHEGANHTKQEIISMKKHLELLYKGYIKNKKKEDFLLNVFWDAEDIEDNFGGRRWINAHRRLRRCRENMDKFHLYLFKSLTSFDGNGGEQFSRYSSISPDTIMEDFNSKYLK